MSLFAINDYRVIIKQTVAARKARDASQNFQSLANALRIQKSYISKILRGYGDFTQDQLWQICGYLGFTAEERHYLELLLEYSRSSYQPRREELKKLIDQIQTRTLNTKAYLPERPAENSNIRDYYLNPLHQLLHIAFSVPHFARDPRRLAEALRIQPRELEESIRALESMRLIQQTPRGIEVLVPDLHLPQDSALYQVWRSQLKIMSLQKKIESGTDYDFMAVVSIDAQTQKNLHVKFLELVREMAPAVKASKSEQLCFINLELARWA